MANNKKSTNNRLDLLLTRAKQNCYWPSDFLGVLQQAKDFCESPSDFLRLYRVMLENYRQFTRKERAFQSFEKKRPGEVSGKLDDAQGRLNAAENLLALIPEGKNDFDDPVYRLAFMELCDHSETLMLNSVLSQRVALGADLSKRQKNANKARTNGKGDTVANIIKNLAKRQDYNPSELWDEFFGDLDSHGLDPDPEEDGDRIIYHGGTIRYDAFRKRIIRYRK